MARARRYDEAIYRISRDCSTSFAMTNRHITLNITLFSKLLKHTCTLIKLYPIGSIEIIFSKTKRKQVFY